MKKFSIISLIVLALFTSCEKVLDIDDIDSQRHVAVNGLPTVDSALFVNITYSRFFLDNRPFVAVTGAEVSVEVNGTVISSGLQEGANYYFNHIVQEGDTLTLHVDIAGRDHICGGTRVPAMPDMTLPHCQIDTTQPFDMGDITFTLRDPSAENYYYIYIMEHDSGSRWDRYEERWDTIDTVANSYFTCLNPEIVAPEVNSSEGLLYYYTSLLFTDSLIEGAEYEVKLSIPMPNDTAEHPIQRRYRLVVQSLSREAFRYIREVSASQGIAQYFAEPSSIFTNLSGGGLGIFAGVARKEYQIEFELTAGGEAK